MFLVRSEWNPQHSRWRAAADVPKELVAALPRACYPASRLKLGRIAAHSRRASPKESRMSLSMYQASVPVFIRNLHNLAGIVRKAEAHASAHKIDPAVLLGARLYPTMLPFSRQVQMTTDHAKIPGARLAGVERPVYDDGAASFDELQERIAKTIAFLETLTPAQIDGKESSDVVLPLPSGEITMKGDAYLLGFVYPNLYFHLTTAYAILRHSGVELGKLDFTGAPPK